MELTFNVAICMFGFLLPILRLKDRIASFGCTVLDLIRSETSKFRAISSLCFVSETIARYGASVGLDADSRTSLTR